MSNADSSLGSASPVEAAQHPDASGEALERLATRDDPEVRRAVAAHPNTPADVLVELAGDFPEAFLGNPAAMLLSTENPALPGRVPAEALHRALAPDEVPSNWLAWCCGHPDDALRLRVAEHPSTPPAVLFRLTEDPESRVRARLTERPDLPAELLERLASDASEDVRCIVAIGAETPPPLLARLVKDSSSNVRLRAARHPDTPPHALEGMGEDPDVLVRVALTERPDPPQPVVERLTRDRIHWVRRRVAAHPETPAALIERLAEDESEPVRERAGRALSERSDS